MSSIAGENGMVQLNWYHGGIGKRISFSGFEKLTEDEFIALNDALMHDHFLEDIQEWANKNEFVRKLKGK